MKNKLFLTCVNHKVPFCDVSLLCYIHFSCEEGLLQLLRFLSPSLTPLSDSSLFRAARHIKARLLSVSITQICLSFSLSHPHTHPLSRLLSHSHSHYLTHPLPLSFSSHNFFLFLAISLSLSLHRAFPSPLLLSYL